VTGGLLMLAAGVAVVELWRRGYLANVIDDARRAATGQPARVGDTPAYASRRKFKLPTAVLGGSGGSHLS
jgi:hypothetical protein